MEIPYTISTRPDTGLWNAKIGIWLFLASEVMLFGGLFSAYIFLRIDSPPGMWPHGLLNVPVGTMNTAILIISSVTVVLAWAALKMRRYRAYWWYMLATITCGLIFLTVKLAYEWPQKFDHFGAFIKKDALEKYEPYLGNHHLAEKGLQIRVMAAPMGAIEIAKDAADFRQDLLKTTLESFRTTFAKSGLRDWKSGRTERATVDGLELLGQDATVSALWVRADVVRNDADGRSYVFLLTGPQKFQKDALAEYQRILASWKWTRR